ncbi:MAG TPA: EAL domain-containing protein [Usitatibacter sp.]|nr:EAL domain-containing protein [Usitatibacter sp.]
MKQTWAGVVDGLDREGLSASLKWGGVVLTTQFQPIFGVNGPAQAGFEALVRAVDADGRIVRAEKLFDAASRAGTLSVLDRACRALHLRNFATVDPGEGRLFLNVVPDAAVEDAARAEEFAALVRYYGLTPKRLCIEVLARPCVDETALVDAVAAYREIGAGIAMDDFGAGRSNFDRIGALRPELVKIERSMLAEAMGESRAREHFASLVRMVGDSGAKVAIGGIESAPEALLAIDSGARYLQGHYLAAPSSRLPGDDLGGRVVKRLLTLRSPGIAVATGD